MVRRKEFQSLEVIGINDIKLLNDFSLRTEIRISMFIELISFTDIQLLNHKSVERVLSFKKVFTFSFKFRFLGKTNKIYQYFLHNYNT